MAQTVALRERPMKAPATPLRFVTAASLFDGHDAAINIMRRLLQGAGAEVVHLGHNRSVGEIVRAAIQEDAHAIAVSSYQGGHVEFFGYMLDMLRERGAARIQVFGGGGGVIVPAEIDQLHSRGVARIYSPEDGQQMGLEGMIADMLERTAAAQPRARLDLEALRAGDESALARVISAIADGWAPASLPGELRALSKQGRVPVIGITGTGGAGKSSLCDELVRRFRLDHAGEPRIAVIAVDPSRRRHGGALLGDRIRMNAIDHPDVYVRSLATRASGAELPANLRVVIDAVKAAGYGIVIVETSGIGQGDAAIAELADLSLYVMTPEFGAPSQLEKIDMLDFADLVAINKFDRRGARDALRDVRKQLQRNTAAFAEPLEAMAVYGTIASRFNDDGVTALYHGIAHALRAAGFVDKAPGRLAPVEGRVSSRSDSIVPGARGRYLAEIAEVVRDYHRTTLEQVRTARERQQLREVVEMLAASGKGTGDVAALLAARDASLDAGCRALLDAWPGVRERYGAEELITRVHDEEQRHQLRFTTLAGTSLPRVSLPAYADEGALLEWLRKEHLPGHFPYTAGVFPLKRLSEEPSRMFAGEGDARRTNRRFKLLSADSEATRLSTAFDSVTLYGFDPDERPDIYGKVGNSGVSIATLDDMRTLYEGFDLSAPQTSVSMTINGPAPAILAMFLNTAIDQSLARFEREHGRAPEASEAAGLRAATLASVRGTVQADILKEDQGQNTCIFSTEFSLRVMGDIAQWFVDNRVRHFYSVSISGYHIAEAGANPITQLAFTLANGFTYVEAYLARGMHIDDFAPNLSFFFSNGMDPEYTVMGRVARRIWALALRERYGAGARSQKLKYHIQTSGRSLHAQEVDFNDIRTTLQALIATYDHCNSLHTNAFDEAVTTPTTESVRRALAIQLIINREWGLAKTENANQGAFIIEELTDLVEEAVLAEFDRLSERGGVLGAMETGYQRGRIQDESMVYERAKHDGSLPIVGVNTFRAGPRTQASAPLELARSTEAEKRGQIARLSDFHRRHASDAPKMLERLATAAAQGQNVFAVLMDAVRCCSLGQITHALFEVGGQYRRNM